MRKLTLTLVAIAIASLTFAQGKYGKTPEDSIVCIESLIYKDYLKSDPALAMSLWKKAYKTCPESQLTLYINGVKMYQDLIRDAKDAKTQQAYKDTMYSIFDQRIAVFGDEAKVLGIKGQTMLVFSKNETQATFDVLNKAIDLGKNETEPGTMVAVMFAVVNLEKDGKKAKSDVVEMYEKCLDIIAKNTDDSYAEAQKKVEALAAPYLDCEILVPMAEKNFEANKGNVDWLRRTMKLLRYKKCYDAAVFAKVAESYFALEPSAEGAEGMGKLFLGKKDYTKAIEFFNKAAEMSQKDEEKAQFMLSIAEAYLYAKNYSSARSYANKALALKSNLGDAYIVIGDAYLYSASSCDDGELGKWGAYWAAVDKYQKARSVDEAAGEEANKKIARVSSSFPTTKDLFFYGKQKGDAYTVACWINEGTSVRTSD
ncbi:MAG: tetratricopeptide repeat protein [Flavobacteriales bacterium]|nr:tetratricopeptide repeat protein [Flavobacteriales bacterium]